MISTDVPMGPVQNWQIKPNSSDELNATKDTEICGTAPEEPCAALSALSFSSRALGLSPSGLSCAYAN
jgi:hypothetical protein